MQYLFNNKDSAILSADFHEYASGRDPVALKASRSKYRTPPPSELISGTPAPATKAQADRYPDAERWRITDDKELDTLDEAGAIDWNDPHAENPPTPPIPMIFNRKYKVNKHGKIAGHKSRCSLWGDPCARTYTMTPAKQRRI